MIRCATGTFTNPEDCRENVPGLNIDLVLTAGGNFAARLIRINTSRLSLFHLKETVRRIAYIALPPGPVFISFPTRHHPPQIWNGVAMRRGEIMVHSNAQQFHQRTSGSGGWGFISVTSKELAKYSKALSQVELTSPPTAKIVVPSSNDVGNIVELHRRACRLAETQPELMVHREVTRALEQDLLHSIVNCFKAHELRRDNQARSRRAEIMSRYEGILTAHEHTQQSTSELAASVGVSERTLRTCCLEFLGMSPGCYARLRRLNLVRAELRRTDPEKTSVAAIAGQYGFSDLGVFTAAYCNAFGETPSMSFTKFQ